MRIFVEEANGHNSIGLGGHRFVDTTDLPMPCIQAGRPVCIKLIDDGKPMTATATSKPPYRVPTMDEIRAIPWNGLKVASTFSGAGGSCTGYRMAGYRVVWANEFVPAAQASYKANASEHCHLDCRDIKHVQPEDILTQTGLKVGELDLFDGSPPCFAAGTPVATLRGVVAIEDVVVGDMVLTHMNRWRRVTATMSRKSPTVVVDGRIECTPEHLFYSRKCENRWDNSRRNYRDMIDAEPTWIAASNVTGAFCATPINVGQVDIPEPPDGFSYSPYFWYTVGRWIGDGWLRLDPGDPSPRRENTKQNDSPVPCLNCGKPSIANKRAPKTYTNFCSIDCRIKQKQKRKRPRHEVIICTEKSDTETLKAKLEQLGTVVGVSTERTVSKLHISRKSLAEWLLRWFGRGAGGKTLPGWVLGMPVEYRQELFEGYIAADGNDKQATTISRCLVTGMALLATGLGKTVGICGPYQNRKNTIEGRVVNARPQWMVRFAKDDGRYTHCEGEMRWRKIRRALKPGSSEATVYDIEVEEDHSFVADVFVVHNCQAFSTAGNREKGWGKKKTYEHGASQCNETLFSEYIRLLRGLMPKTFVAENVSGLIKGTAKGYFLEILRDLKASGYRVKCQVLDAQWLGVPQTRQRTIFIGVREDLKLDPVYPVPFKYQYSVRDALPHIGKAIDDTGGTSPNRWAADVNITNRPSPAITIGVNSVNSCHYKIEEPFDVQSGAYPKHYSSSSAPSPAIVAGRTTEMKGPTERRKFTIQEVKAICSFPDDFIPCGSYAQQWERLGNSVPPLMMKSVAEVIRDRILLPK
jgi:DNA-cytosine methyltransferase